MEAIKTAVACKLGVAFVSKLAVEREVAAGQLSALTVQGIPLTRSLRCVANPARYQSRAVRAFIDLMFEPSTHGPADVPTPLKEEVYIFSQCPPPRQPLATLCPPLVSNQRKDWVVTHDLCGSQAQM